MRTLWITVGALCGIMPLLAGCASKEAVKAGDSASGPAAPPESEPVRVGKWTFGGEGHRQQPYEFTDPTFIDKAIRIRSHYQIAHMDGKNRICWLLADAVTRECKTPREKALALLKWVCETVPHNFGGDDRGRPEYYRMHALDIIERGWARCEPTVEVYATLCWLIGIPARVLSIQADVPQPKAWGHHVTEVFIEGKWVMMDPDLYRYFELEDGTLASAMELTQRRDLVARAELERAKKSWEGPLAFLNNWKKWAIEEDGTPRYPKMLHVVYVQEGVYSIDGFYGGWVRLREDTKDYLYGSPKHPDAKELLKTGSLPWNYLRSTTRIEDHFHRPWEPPWK